ncbi:hypothetical protein F5Y19DRAFT_483354 [Xylariaceae sp. FL1651]|nr:hypothetical protein F5Y19DRAFT_483354 [Xylariaceae sp. FL1651]
MPSALDVDSQFRFLISCIRHSTAGKVDFEEVRKECEIISKGAAAKRYERLMKAHNITTSTAAGGVKNETKDADDIKKPKARGRAKKRKLEEVNEDEGDVDEPVKSEPKVKGEVKYEDAIVKSERANDDLPTTAPPDRLPSHPQPAISSADAQNGDDDDEVFFVSATQKRSASNAPSYGRDHHHSHAHLPTPQIPGAHSFDYAANMSLPQQLAPPRPSQPPMTAMETPTSSDSFPYGFAPTTWIFPHDTHGYL